MQSSFKIDQNSIKATNASDNVVIGYVVNNDDPMQMGRVQVRCFDFDDDPSDDDSLPWAFVCSPHMGTTQYNEWNSSGNGGTHLHGLVATPSIGSIAIVAGVHGNTTMRVCLGFITDEFVHNTFPNHAYFNDGKDVCGPSSSDGDVSDIFSDNASTAFGEFGETNYERITRSYDRPASALVENTKHNSKRTEAVTNNEMIFTLGDGDRIIEQGYNNDPGLPGDISKTNTVYGWRSPAGHVVYMDDSLKNSRIKLCTIKGSQILLDDTNERIYINTAEGNNWIEMDFDGNTDIYSKANLSIRSGKNINLTADDQVLITGKKGVHIHSDTIIRMTCVDEMNINVGTNLKITSSNSFEHVAHSKHSTIIENVTTKSATHMVIADTLILQGTDTSITTSAIKIGGSSVDITGSGAIKMTGGAIHLNGPGATAPSSATDPTDPLNPLAFWTNRVPDHEPWPRRDFLVNNTDHITFNYMDINDPLIGREYETNLSFQERNAFWHR